MTAEPQEQPNLVSELNYLDYEKTNDNMLGFIVNLFWF